MHPILNIAVLAVRNAGDYIIKNYEKYHFMKNFQKEKYIFLNKIISISKKILVKIIKRYYPDHFIISQENLDSFDKISGFFWIINPLDSFIDFFKGFPFFFVSVSVYINGRTEFSAIYNPILNELFTSIRGGGAKLNGYRIRINQSVQQEFIVVSVHCLKIDNKINDIIDILNKKLNKIIFLRRISFSILDLVYISIGRVDIFFGIDLDFLSFIAVELLIKESGGMIIDFSVKNTQCTLKTNIIAGNPVFIRKII